MVAELEEAGLAFVGKDETGKMIEIIELPTHPYFIGVQFHPEFKSRPGKPSAPFLGLTAASCGLLDGLLGQDSRLPKGVLPSKVYRNGNPKKTRNHIQEGSFYLNGNGVHALTSYDKCCQGMARVLLSRFYIL